MPEKQEQDVKNDTPEWAVQAENAVFRLVSRQAGTFLYLQEFRGAAAEITRCWRESKEYRNDCDAGCEWRIRYDQASDENARLAAENATLVELLDDAQGCLNRGLEYQENLYCKIEAARKTDGTNR